MQACDPCSVCIEGAPETFPVGADGARGPFMSGAHGAARQAMPGGPRFIGCTRGYGAEE